MTVFPLGQVGTSDHQNTVNHVGKCPSVLQPQFTNRQQRFWMKKATSGQCYQQLQRPHTGSWRPRTDGTNTNILIPATRNKGSGDDCWEKATPYREEYRLNFPGVVRSGYGGTLWPW